MPKYVLPTVDKIEAAYLAQLEKVAKFKETLQMLSQTTFEQYQAMFDEMIDIAAAQTEAEIQHLNEVLNTFGLQLSDEVKEKMAADIAAAKEACKEKVAETITKLTPDTSLNPIQAAQYGLIRTMEELLCMPISTIWSRMTHGALIWFAPLTAQTLSW